MNHYKLAKLVSDLNTQAGYAGRYTLVQRQRSSIVHTGNWAIMKKEGQLDRNVSGWATPLQLIYWVNGHLEGFSAHSRRLEQKAPPALATSFNPPTKDGKTRTAPDADLSIFDM